MRAWDASPSCCSPCSRRWNAPSPPNASPMPALSHMQLAAASVGRSPTWKTKIEYARLLKEQGSSLEQIAAKTGIPKASLHRYLSVLDAGGIEERPS